MSAAVLNRPVTKHDLLSMPQDGMDRWVIYGKLREKPMTVRDRFHSHIMGRLAHLLNGWLDQQPGPRGQVLCGEAGICLPSNPESTVGVDVAYISAAIAAQQNESSTIIDGVPILIAEILSPSDALKETHEKIKLYLDVGVPVIWIIDPADQTIRIYEPGKKPRLVNSSDPLSAEPHLPGFSIRAGQLFE